MLNFKPKLSCFTVAGPHHTLVHPVVSVIQLEGVVTVFFSKQRSLFHDCLSSFRFGQNWCPGVNTYLKHPGCSCSFVLHFRPICGWSQGESCCYLQLEPGWALGQYHALNLLQ